MSLKTVLKSVAFVVLSLAAFAVSYQYYNRSVLQPSDAPEQVGVSIGYDPATKMMTVTMDGKTNSLPIDQAQSSPFYQKAIERVAVNGMAKIQQGQTAEWWLPMIGMWILFELIIGVLMWRL